MRLQKEPGYCLAGATFLALDHGANLPPEVEEDLKEQELRGTCRYQACQAVVRVLQESGGPLYIPNEDALFDQCALGSD